MGRKYRRPWGTAGELEQLSAQIPGEQKTWVETQADELKISPSVFVEQMIKAAQENSLTQADGHPSWAFRPDYVQEEADLKAS